MKDLTKVEIDAVVDQRRLLQMFYALAAVVPLGAFSGNCSTARWAAIDDACWDCMCGA